MAGKGEKGVINRLEDLNGIERAAVVLLALGEQKHTLWELMDEQEIKEISQAMSNLGLVGSNVVEDLLIDFVTRFANTGALIGTYEQTQRLLPAGRTMWDKLANVNEVMLATYLKNEYPQTVAVILSKIRPDHAARVLAVLPDDFALECMNRMMRMEPIQREILDKIEDTLRTEFMSNLARTSKRDAHEQMAEIFNNFDRQTETRFMEQLEERNREAAERIRALMFVFEDLQKLDPTGVQTLLRSVDKGQLALALKGASDKVRDLFLNNMSERAAKILREDMGALGPVRLRDVEAAQSQMVMQAKELAARGEIVLADNKGDDELIY
jgi:flagellar motor switch protein FliG